MMDICDAIYSILSSSKKPLHFKELARLLKDQGFEISGSQTLETIINARVGLEIQKALRQGKKARFLKLPGGLIAINTEHQDKVRAQDFTQSEPFPSSQPLKPSHKGKQIRLRKTRKKENISGSDSISSDFLPSEEPPPSDNDRNFSLKEAFMALQKSRLDYEAALRKELLERIISLEFNIFERLLECAISSFGFLEFSVVNRRKDGRIEYGINLTGLPSNFRVLLSVKRFLKPSKLPKGFFEEIQTAMKNFSFGFGIVVILGGNIEITPSKLRNSGPPFTVITDRLFLDFLIARQIGVKERRGILEIDDDFWSTL